MKMKTALTIAGSDCSGGAGIQADIKTMTMNGVYAMSAITALTAQNTTGVRAIQESTPEFLKQQLDSIFEDIWFTILPHSFGRFIESKAWKYAGCSDIDSTTSSLQINR